MPAAIEWRPVTLVKRFAGSAETLLRHPDVIGGVALSALLILLHLERGAQPPRMR